MPTYKLSGIDVHFPYNAYDCQLVYMERVIQSLQKGCNALLESPTGTGKTLCLLCATLAWRESLGSMSTYSWPDRGSIQSSGSQFQLDSSLEITKPTLPTIIYTSRTHSQLQQVVRELKSCSYRPKMVVLGSREQMCIHKDVKKMQGRSQNNACRSLCKSRSCHHQNRVTEYLKGHPELGDEPIDIEDLVSIGRTQGPCPYYLSRELHSSADLLFAPYNYLIDKDNRRSLTGINWENTVLIFDEAHNLENICADAASFDLPCSYLTACIAEAKQCIDLAHLRRAAENSAETSLDPDNFAILKELNITVETANMLIDTIDHAASLLEDESSTSSATIKPKIVTCRLQTLRDALKIVFRKGDSSFAASYRVHIHEPYSKSSENGSSKGQASRTLSWWCFNPGIAMEEFSRIGVRSIILTSGTLAPLESFAVELNLPFDVRLENPHVIESNQIWVGVVSSGPSGRPLNSSYRTRDLLEYKQELGNTIVNFARIVPDGLLVFFPSYYILNQCIECWKTMGTSTNLSTIWERICKHKQPVVEPKQSALFNYANEDFMAKLNDDSSSGAVFFAVCRGKVSEGLDFADRSGRAVVVTGIPYAMKTDPKVRLKREYLDEQARLQGRKTKAMTGEEWYVQQAARAVNQAVGRVIRHRHDYGAIILCDERFAHSNTQNQMSLWLRPHIKCYRKFGDAAFTLTRFFRDMRMPVASKELMTNDTNKSSPKLSSKEVIDVHLADDGPNFNSSLSEVTQDAPRLSMDTFLSSRNHTDIHLGDDPPGLNSSLSELMQGLGSKRQLADQHNNTGIFGRKTTAPLFFSSQISSGMGLSGPQKSLSSILAAERGKSLSCRMTIDTITPANCAIGCADGKNPTMQSKEPRFSPAIKSNKSNIGGNFLVLEKEDCELVELDDKSSLSVNCGPSAKRFKTVPTFEAGEASGIVNVDVPSGQVSQQKMNLDSKISAVMIDVSDDSDNTDSDFAVKHPTKHVYGELKRKTHANKINSSKKEGLREQDGMASDKVGTDRRVKSEDEKKNNASSFLRQVRAKLSDPEYSIFMECMKGLKQKTTVMDKVLEVVANLFCAPERIFLLKRFGDFVPSQYQELYKKHLNTRCATICSEGEDECR
ncbi:regulator of telomere elongation helicase 1 homolog isoform X2 [Cryptomeria japonica]|uniref:regulator of telomere elongation helicase 1 homolog isoform X2 n=1 Tax=Cryptomeria japonica TaxID=3369 RepID=UPI0027DA33CF|nr:regulator of telomere elongation helicase 1 homolog isoform X2 [Cryptomeria japonica]